MRIEARLAVAVAIVATAGRAYGEDSAVGLQIDGCANDAEIRRIVAIELANAPRSAHEVRASIACTPTHATLRVASGTAAPTERTVELAADAPKAHGRLIALALVELLATSQTEATATAAVPASPTGPVEPPREPIDSGGGSASNELAAWQLLAFGGALAFSSDTGVLGGGGVRLRRAGSVLASHVDVQAHHGATEVALGRVTTDTFDMTAAIGAQHAWGRVRASVSAGLRGGAVRLAGDTDEMNVRSDQFWAPWFGALAIAGVDIRVGARFAFMVELDGGLVIYPVGALVGQQREIAVDGGWLGVNVGLGMFL